MRAGLILAAAGVGRRFGSKKQFAKLHGKTMMELALRPFLRFREIKEFVVVVPEEDLARAASAVLRRRGVLVVAGGKTRAQSVRKGLAALGPEIDWVVVHDAARPFVSSKIIRHCLRSARKTGAALCALPASDTVKIHRKHFVTKTLPRDNVVLVQTPQVFRRKILERAYLSNQHLYKKGRFQFSATDDSSLVERLGVRVRIVEGSPKNLKITTPQDFFLARTLLHQ